VVLPAPLAWSASSISPMLSGMEEDEEQETSTADEKCATARREGEIYIAETTGAIWERVGEGVDID